MFLTNNYLSIYNLLMYSKGKYTYKIKPRLKSKSWLYYFRARWENYLKNGGPNFIIDYTIKPYGNINKGIDLKTNNKEEIIVIDTGGKIWF